MLAAIILRNIEGEAPDISNVEPIKASLSQLIMWLTVAWTTAAFGEEIIWRGFLIGQLAKIFNETRTGWIISLIISSVFFGLLHAQQGLSGVILTGVVGLVLGSAYLIFRNNLWVSIIAHGLTNSISFLMLYFGYGQ